MQQESKKHSNYTQGGKVYSTPLKSKVDKNRASFLLSLLIKPEEKIKFAFCTDLILENSLYNEDNEHYFYDEYLVEFWTNYNANRKRLYSSLRQLLKANRSIVESCLSDLRTSSPIKRSSLIFISNNYSDNLFYGSKIIKEPDTDNLHKLFTKTNKIQEFRDIKRFETEDTTTVLECLSMNCHTKELFYYFDGVITNSKNVYLITDHPGFKNKFRKRIHINDQYYLCYEKEKQ